MTPSELDSLYAFAFRGDLARESVGRATRRTSSGLEDDAKYARVLSQHLLDDEKVAAARRMAVVYTTIAAFENMIRDLVEATMLEEVGENWWSDCVSERIRKKAEARKAEEDKHRWHGERGDRLLDYTDMKELASIFLKNWDHFAELINTDFDWMKHILHTLERSRNVIMHSGQLDKEDVERLGINIRDWIRQVGV